MRRNFREKPKKDKLELEGVIEKVLPGGQYKIMLDTQSEIVATPNAKMRMYSIRMIVGDRVKVELSPYDLSKGRITFRLNKQVEESGK